MTISLVVEEKDAQEQIPEDIYEAVLKEVDEGTGIHGDYVRFDFEIRKGDYAGVVKNLIASKKLTRPKSGGGKTSKLYDIVKILSGSNYENGEEVILDDLIGKGCQIVVKDGKEKDGIMFQTISHVMPSKES